MQLSKTFFALIPLTLVACTGGGDGTTLPGLSSSGLTSSGEVSTSSGGNGGSTSVNDTFSHTCASDADCTTVFIGSTCGICASANTAIANTDRAAYQTAYNSARANCPANRAVGDCAASYGVSQCSASKTCTFVSCPTSPKDEHHCQ